MKAFRKRPGEGWELIEVENTLEALQKQVGGYIETVSFMKNTCIICNEEGLLIGLPVNVFLDYPFRGTLLIVGVDGEEFCDVDERMKEML
jgi:hypothetical protein